MKMTKTKECIATIVLDIKRTSHRTNEVLSSHLVVPISDEDGSDDIAFVLHKALDSIIYPEGDLFDAPDVVMAMLNQIRTTTGYYANDPTTTLRTIADAWNSWDNETGCFADTVIDKLKAL